MKQLLAVGLLYFNLLGVHAQKLSDSVVPVTIKNAFAKMYPDIKKAEWNMESSLYKACFAEKNYKGSVMFDKNAKWTEREVVVPEKSLPASIETYMETNYKNIKITEIAKVTKASGEILYKVGIGSKQILFTKEGDFIKVS